MNSNEPLNAVASQLYDLPDGWARVPGEHPGITYTRIIIWVLIRNGAIVSAFGDDVAHTPIMPDRDREPGYLSQYVNKFGTNVFDALLPLRKNTWIDKYEVE